MTLDTSMDAETGSEEASPAPRARRSQQRRRQRRIRAAAMGAYGVAVLMLAAAIPVLGYIGVRAVLNSSDGEVVDPVEDPSEPGYRALVPPSPTLLVFQTGDAGELVGAALLSLTSEDGDGGAVLLVPPGTIADLPDIGEISIDASFGFSGRDAAKFATEWVLGVGIDDAVVLTRSEWTDLLESTGSLAVTNPDELRTPEDGVVFERGRLELTPEEIPRFAAFVGPEETRLNRLLRQELVWSAWLDELAADPSGATFPGEQERGVARFLPTIVSGDHRLESMPIDVEGPVGEDEVVIAPDEDAVRELVPQLVPFPAGSASVDRPLVRVLAGTDDQSLIFPAARRVVAAGGQVVMIGNADEFGHATTEIHYFDPSRRSDAEAIAEELGFGSVIQVDEIDDSAQIIVVLGADADL